MTMTLFSRLGRADFHNELKPNKYQMTWANLVGRCRNVLMMRRNLKFELQQAWKCEMDKCLLCRLHFDPAEHPHLFVRNTNIFIGAGNCEGMRINPAWRDFA